MLRFHLCCWWLWLGLLGGCQSPAPARRITADNYRTTIPDPKTLGETYVSDPDGVLSPGTAADLNARLDSLDQSGRAHIDVVLVRSLEEEVPKTAATALFNRWKIGRQDTKNGLLMLLVLDQHRIEFETGYGLEADLPDIICYRIQQRYMVAAARAGDYDAAVRQGVAALIRRLHPAPTPPRPVLATAADSTQFHIDSLLRVLQAQEDPLTALNSLGTELPGEDPASTYAPPAPELPTGLLVGLATPLVLILYLVLWHYTTRGRRGRGWLVLVPVGLVIGLLVVVFGSGADGTIGEFLALAYVLPLLYLHGYFGWQYGRTRHPVAPAGRPAAYEQRQAAHHGLDFTAYLFPVALALYWPWYRRRLAALRDAPLACPECGQPMQKLSSTAGKEHLEPGQQAEEKMNSVVYDVWACADGHHLPLGYPNPDSRATECPACHYRTLAPPRLRVVQAATYTAGGWGWRVATCGFCQHEEQTKETISRRVRREDAAAASSSSSSWGSSDSSSSGSSSSSSGGSSGGGGAGSTW